MVDREARYYLKSRAGNGARGLKSIPGEGGAKLKSIPGENRKPNLKSRPETAKPTGNGGGDLKAHQSAQELEIIRKLQQLADRIYAASNLKEIIRELLQTSVFLHLYSFFFIACFH